MKAHDAVVMESGARSVMGGGYWLIDWGLPWAKEPIAFVLVCSGLTVGNSILETSRYSDVPVQNSSADVPLQPKEP